jgi:protein-serine/threonine kinase
MLTLFPLRSPLLDPDSGLGFSGLDRIRQQPLSRVFTLPNLSTPSVGQQNSPPNRSSATTSRAASVYLPSGGTIPPFEDLHRFPSESLHSFSFAQRSEELLHNRQNILKRSIDFMKDRLGWAATGPGLVNAQARISGDGEFQGMVDLLAKASVLDRDSQGRQSNNFYGPVTSPPEIEGENVFEKSFQSPGFSSHYSPFPQFSADAESVDDSQLLNPIYDDNNIYSRRRDLRSAPSSRRVSLKRTYTDLSSASLQTKLMETLAQPYAIGDSLSSSGFNSFGLGIGPVVHTHSSKWTPVSQAVFRTEAKAPWTIISANDLACLVFGVTQSEVRKLSILEVVQEERRGWLESKLQDPTTDATAKFPHAKPRFNGPKAGGMGNGVTAQLLSKPSSRQKVRRAQTDDGYGSSTRNQRKPNHAANKSRGVLLCGDVVPIQKRNGGTGSASLWVMEKRGGLIWVLEEITENVAYITCDESGHVTNVEGDANDIWGKDVAKTGALIQGLFPEMPKECVDNFEKTVDLKYFGAYSSGKSCIPTTVTKNPSGGPRSLRVSSFPHVAGMMVLSSSTLNIISSNSVFSSALFGQERPEGHHISELVPEFETFLNTLTEEDKVSLVDGMVIPEHSFRRARDLLLLRENKANAVSIFFDSEGLPARHRDGSPLSVDIQMRIVKSETVFPDSQSKREENVASHEHHESDHEDDESADTIAVTEVVYALWITYSRQIHGGNPNALSPDDQSAEKKPTTPIHQPRSGQRTPSPTPTLPSHSNTPSLDNKTPMSLLSQKLNEAASTPLADRTAAEPNRAPPVIKEPLKKKTISDYVILEEMGQGAYGQVKLARLKKSPLKKMVLKYVTKKRILVDTWTRDRRLGTVPLEIHVLDYLRRDGFRHPNIVEMEGFFEDEINYYIEMVPHGLPGMDLFDYIELRSNMDEGECRNIFKQVVDAIHHLHTKALVVHRDIKDENVVLDGEGRIKLIDFGSAAYIKNGPFDVFVGTIGRSLPLPLLLSISTNQLIGF